MANLRGNTVSCSSAVYHRNGSTPTSSTNTKTLPFVSSYDNDNKKRKAGILKEKCNLVKQCERSCPTESLDSGTTICTSLFVASSLCNACADGVVSSASAISSVFAIAFAGLAFVTSTASVNKQFTEAKSERNEAKLERSAFLSRLEQMAAEQKQMAAEQKQAKLERSAILSRLEQMAAEQKQMGFRLELTALEQKQSNLMLRLDLKMISKDNFEQAYADIQQKVDALKQEMDELQTPQGGSAGSSISTYSAASMQAV